MDGFSLLDDPRTAFALWHLNKVYYKKSKQKEQDIYSSTNHIYIYMHYICHIFNNTNICYPKEEKGGTRQEKPISKS